MALVMEPKPLDLKGALLEGTPFEQPFQPRDRCRGHEGLGRRRRRIGVALRFGPVSVGIVAGLGPRTGSSRSRSAEPGPHGRHVATLPGTVAPRTSFTVAFLSRPS